MKNFLFLFLIFTLACSSDDQDQLKGLEIVAEAEIFEITQVADGEYELKEKVIGKASFSQQDNVVTLKISLSGMTPNTSKAVHLHAGSVQKPGRHWNSGKFVAACNERSLGEVWARPFIGDVGNVPINEKGNGTFSLQTDLWKINTGDDRDILDRVIMIHAKSQDFLKECDPLHSHDSPHANQKIGGGTIKLISEVIQNKLSVTSSQVMPDFLICK